MTSSAAMARLVSWRRAVAKASQDSQALWKTAKWARSAYEPPTGAVSIPPLKDCADGPIVAQAHAEKAEKLAIWFFSALPADLSNISLWTIEYNGN